MRMNSKVLICLAVLATAVSPLTAQTPATTSPPPPSGFDKWADAMKKPVDWLTWGADLRVRDEYLDSVVSLDESVPYSEQNVVRFRGRLWATAKLSEDISINARLSAEPRYWTKKAGFGPYGKPNLGTPREGMEWRYGIFDNLNFKWSNLGGQPLTLTVGRQDIMFGDFYDWWLISDGTPGDGSWTFYFDSVRLTYDAQDIKTKFDLIYIYQTALPDGMFPTLGRTRYSDSPKYRGTDYNVTEQNEQGVVFYVSNKSIKNTTIDGYFIYKADEPETLKAGGAKTRPGDYADIYTLGGKITGTPAEHWLYSVEGAYQFGSKNDPTVKFPAGAANHRRDISAYGGKAKLTYQFKDSLNNQLSLATEYLSGDDPKTGKDEMFDLLWGRWPRWSELYIYSYAAETSGKVAQINNLWRIGPSWSFNPMKGMSFSATYNALFAPEDTSTRVMATPRFSRDGHFRGHYLQTVLKHQFNKHCNVHLWGEFIWQGDYYNQRDLMVFIRPEIMFTF
ncbi:MAG: hypothetical protein BWX84_00852 [Verrucomicrobia bacterium ADurb.Bin118]|nr:MAG: hypothetical protein BWX84_00852 [Verrucomicrobia bacterium ADurb.Bin118]